MHIYIGDGFRFLSIEVDKNMNLVLCLLLVLWHLFVQWRMWCLHFGLLLLVKFNSGTLFVFWCWGSSTERQVYTVSIRKCLLNHNFWNLFDKDGSLSPSVVQSVGIFSFYPSVILLTSCNIYPLLRSFSIISPVACIL